MGVFGRMGGFIAGETRRAVKKKVAEHRAEGAKKGIYPKTPWGGYFYTETHYGIDYARAAEDPVFGQYITVEQKTKYHENTQQEWEELHKGMTVWNYLTRTGAYKDWGKKQD